MRRYGREVGLAACLALLAVGCAGSKEDWSDASPENQGYHWIGAGEPTGFGGAYGFCRSTMRASNAGQRLEGGSGGYNVVPGGPTTIPGYARTTPVPRTEYADRRQFAGCMESQGWAPSEPQVPATQAPQPPSQAPQPTKP